ncbi:MAG: acylphosphatase [Gammaproteobacteria bacterium]
MNRQVKIFVSGRVQGVYYRAFTQKQAIKLGVAGFARNLPDGRVEVLASGSDDAVENLIKWCHKGPITARVDRVTTEEVSLNDIPSVFEIK